MDEDEEKEEGVSTDSDVLVESSYVGQKAVVIYLSSDSENPDEIASDAVVDSDYGGPLHQFVHCDANDTSTWPPVSVILDIIHHMVVVFGYNNNNNNGVNHTTAAADDANMDSAEADIDPGEYGEGDIAAGPPPSPLSSESDSEYGDDDPSDGETSVESFSPAVDAGSG